MPITPTVSIVIPAYNRAGTIRSAIESVLRQTYTDFEVLIVDDGSTDDTMAKVAEISDPRIRMLANPENMGAGAARNTGIDHAKGVWIAFQDSDDEWLPEKLQKQMQLLTAKGADHIACYCGLLVVGQLNQSQHERRQVLYIPDSKLARVDGDISRTVLSTNPASTQTLVIRRDIIKAIGGFDEDLPALEDWEYVLRLAQQGSFAFVDEPLVLQFFSDNSLTRSQLNRATALLGILEKHQALWQAHPRIHAQQYRSAAGEFRRSGDFSAARAAIAKARRILPFAPMLWGIDGYLGLKTMMARLKRPQ